MATSTIEHNFVSLDEKEQTEQKSDKKSTKIAVVVIGKTGAGKSSLINLFCSKAKVGHSTKSATKCAHLYNESKESYYWLDSQGASDSDGTSDDKVLCDILKKLHDENISEIKVIWCVSGDTQSRAAEEFQKQARFIKNGLGNKDNKIWKSCLIVKKKGHPKPSTDLDGLLAAACMSGSDIKYSDNRLFGYSFYDKNTADNTANMALKFITKDAEKNAFLTAAGFWAKDDIKNELNELLSTMSTFYIQFQILKCSNCGSKGDPRFVYAPCHTKSEQHHPGNLIPYHPQQKEKYHPAKPQYYHPKTITKYHSGHKQQKWRHPEIKRSIYYHPEGTYYNYFKHGNLNWRYKCCEKLKDVSFNNGCTFSHDQWTCCGYSGSSSGCESYYAMSCCSRSEYSEGCKTGFGCCYRETTDRGCTQEYGCCNKPISNKGCVEKYSCCDALSDNKGCTMKYKCCNKESGQVGCIQRCSNASCHVQWGNGPGCIEISAKR